MSIYDQIANPKTANFLENLQIVDSMKSRAQQRRLQDIQISRAMQQQEMQRQQQQGYTEGTEYIKSKLGDQVAQFSQENLSDVDVDIIEKADTYDEISNYLLTLPGQEQRAESFMNIAGSIRDRVRKETQEERDMADEMMQQIGNNLAEVAKLEKAGKGLQAEQRYREIMQFISDDPRYMGNPDIAETIEAFGEYKPGLGQYIYLTTMMGEKARQQYLQDVDKDTSKRYKYTDDQGVAWSVSQTDQSDRVKLGRTFAATKEEAVSGRTKQRMELSREKQDLTQEKFEVETTDKMVTHKRQEEKDLKKVKNDLVKAITLAEKGENLPLVDKLIQQSMSKWENTSVRAYAELERFKNIGGLEVRIAGHVSQFLTGEMTESQRQMAIDTAKQLLNEFVNPVLDEGNNYWRRVADERGLDPDQVAPFKTKEEVGEALREGYISEETALKILQKERFKWNENKR